MEGIVVNGEQSALQKHVAFFDRNKDGFIYPSETFKGFRAIGCGLILSTVASLFINMGLSSRTVPKGKMAFPFFPIYAENIRKAKHGSDSGAYDTQGRFVPSKFEDIFRKHAHSNPDSLTSKELDEMLKANQTRNDYAGRLASWTEWKVLFFLCKDKNDLLHKDTVRAVYDGSLFEKMEKEKALKKKN
eukprot:TRINITY_DN16702_c2_g1_i1.p1 TRINITY_DN16702_c2_g1~~TRINITY_DN16702_c2_g1_i1.p1  ORF type:complete len:188 (+),score=39.68 TRINITY_DN16702_c2_g1_i1:116-679(+)